MSDFLTNLAARTLGAIPVVKPRQRSRFEPDSNGEPATLREFVDEKLAPAARSTVDRPTRPHPDHATSAPTPAQNQPTALPNTRVSISPALPSPTVTRGLSRDHPAESVFTTTHTPPASRSDSRDAPISPRLVAQPASAVTQRLAERAAASTLRRDGNAEPSIHVSIGRVEVRAIQRAEKPSPAPPATPAPARSSLGSYLRGSRAPRE